MTNHLQNKFLSILTLLLLAGNSMSGQDENTEAFRISIHGYVKSDYITDSRQTLSAREGHIFLFPQATVYDADGKDINASPNFNILAVQSRLSVKFSGPDFFSMKAAGMIEGDFLGQSNADINGLRLRHAFLTLSSEKIEILMGQTWHPMVILSCYPKVYSLNTGAPFHPASRNPQLRISTKGDLKLIASFVSQRDFTSQGPQGTSSTYLRNAFLPNLNLQTQFTSGKITTGAALDYKILKPRLSIFDTKTDATVQGLSGLVFFKYKVADFEIRTEAVYGNNLPDHLMLGGYAETMYDVTTKDIEYLPFSVISAWIDISDNFKQGEWGLFGGFSDNLGLKVPLANEYYTLGGNIDYIWRIAPRIAYVSGKIKIGLELETTAAAYGVLNIGDKEVNSTGVDPVFNARALLFGMYSF